MKVMDSGPGLGANRRHSRSYDEDLQRRHGFEDALSCFDISGLEYSVRGSRTERPCREATALASPRFNIVSSAGNRDGLGRSIQGLAHIPGVGVG
jgi:hypothetical protein